MFAEKKLRFQNIAEISREWDTMSTWYVELLNSFVSPATSLLIPHLQLQPMYHSADKPISLLEMAVGDGTNSIYIIDKLPKGSKYVGIDVSENMAKEASNNLLNHSIIKSKNIDVNILVGNGEDLKMYNNNTFDRYAASLCLMITVTAQNMVNESYRILKDNGISVWSVWGRKSENNIFCVVDNIFTNVEKLLNLYNENNSNRTHFHLGDYKETKKLFELAGYKKIYGWYSTIAMPIITIEQFKKHYLMAPRCKKILNNYQNDKNKYNEIVNIINNEIEKNTKKFFDDHEPLIHEVLCIVAQK